MAQRVNTRFLIIMTVAVAAFIALALAAKFYYHRDPTNYAALGDTAAAIGDWETAVSDYNRALSLGHGDPDLYIRLGVALEHRVGADRGNFHLAEAAYENALVVDPANAVAARHLLDMFVGLTDIQSSPAILAKLKDYAAKLAHIDSSDRRASAYQHVATILLSQTSGRDASASLTEAFDALARDVREVPADPDLPYYYARGKLSLAAAALKEHDTESAARLARDAAAIVGAALAAKPDDAVLNWRAATVYTALPLYDPEGAVAYQDKAVSSLAHAKAIVAPTDVRYGDIQISGALAAASHRHFDDAEAILRALAVAQPDNLAAQLELGSFMGRIRGNPTEAIKILSLPSGSGTAVGAAALRTRDLEEGKLYQLARFRIQLVPSTTDEAAKQKLLAQIDESYKSLVTLVGAHDSFSLLHLKAQIQQLKGSDVEAMATYQQALSVMEHADNSDPDLMYHAALLDAKEGQSGAAEKLFLRVIEADPIFLPPYVALADQHLQENAPEKAQTYIESAEKLAPLSSFVLQLRVRLLVQQHQQDAARAAYAKLPETTVAQQSDKAKLALLVGDAKDAARLLEPLQKQSPDDPAIGGMLAQAYVASDQGDQARAMVDAGLARNPKSVWLLVLRQRLLDATGTRTDQIDPQILAAADDFTRELLGFETEVAAGKPDAAEAHLAAADRIKPNDKRVEDLYFQYELSRSRFDQAEQHVAKLAALNADGAEGQLYRVRLAMAKGDKSGAVQAARDLVTRHPEFSESFAMLGSAFANSGAPEKAVPEYKNALDRQHDNFRALLGLIDAYLQLRQPERAEQAIADAQKLYPHSSTFHEKAIDYDLAYSDHPEVAVDERQRMLDAAPNDPAAHIALAQAALRVAERDQAINPAASSQFLDRATDVLTKADGRWPQNLVIVGLLAQIQQYRGDSAGAEKMLLDLAASAKLAGRPEPALLLADFYQRVGNRDAAIKSLRDAFEKSNHAVEIELKLATVLAQSRQFDDALSLLHDQNGSDPRIGRQRLETFIAAGRFDEAERGIKAALAASPNSVDLLDLLATDYISAGRFADARPVARQAIALAPTDNDALYHQAGIELQLPDGDLDLAMRDAIQLKTQNSTSAFAYQVMADVYGRKHQLDDAVRTLEDGLKAVPLDRALRLHLLLAYRQANPPLWSQYDTVVHDAQNDPQLKKDTIWLVKDAEGLAARKQFDAALQKVDQAIAVAPSNASLIADKLSILMDAANYPAVIATADDSLAKGAKAWWLYVARGSAKSHSDKPAALVDFDAALAAAPDFQSSASVIGAIVENIGIPEALSRAQAHDGGADWRLLAASLLVKKGDYSGAIAEATPLRQTTTPKPQRLQALSLLAQSDSNAHLPQDARDAYIEALTIAPDDTEILNNLANVLADDLHEPQQALPYSRRAYDLSRQSGQFLPSVSDTHGWVLTLCGGSNAAQGLDILQKLVEEHQDFLYARYHLGEAYLRSAMPADSVKQLEIAQMQVQKAEDSHAQVDAELKSAIAASLSKARQILDGKADAGVK